MKIGLIGAECTGKTTLGRMLAAELQLPLIGELVRDIVARHGYERVEQMPDVVKAQRLYLTAQVEKQIDMSNISYISDRTPLDNSAYMLLYAAPKMMQQAIDDFLYEATFHTQTYDLLLYFPIAWKTENDGFRHTDEGARQDIQDYVRQLIISMNVRGKVYEVKAFSQQDRLTEVLREVSWRFKFATGF